MDDLNELKSRVKDAFFANPADFCPEFDFRQRGGNWQSYIKLSGERRNRVKTAVLAKHKNLFAVDDDAAGVEIWDYIAQRDGLDFYQAFVKCCNIAGVPLPESTQKAIQTAAANLAALDAMHRELITALYTPDGRPVFDYLAASIQDGGRGYTPETIKGMNLGAVTPGNLARLQKIQGYEKLTLPGVPGRKMPALAIPQYYKGRLNGFKIRFFELDAAGKYHKPARPFYENTTGRRGIVYYLPLAYWPKLDADQNQTPADYYKNNGSAILVESETDALHAAAAGIENVFCASSRAINPDQADAIKAAGYSNLIVCFDTESGKTAEDADKKNQAAIKAAAATMQTANAAGLDVWFTRLPQKDHTEKTDLDSYLNTHTAADFYDHISAAGGLCQYADFVVLDTIRRHTAHTGGTIKTDYQKTAIAGDVFTQLQGNKNTLADVLDTLAEQYNEPAAITADRLAAWTAEQQRAADREKQNQVKKALRQMADGITPGTAADIANQMQKTAAALAPTNRRFAKYIKNITPADREKIFNSTDSDIKTGYTLKRPSDGVNIDFTIDRGGVTLIAAPTGHGKSKALQNILLNITATNPGKTYLYINLEESYLDKFCQLVNNVYDRKTIHHDSMFDNVKFIKQFIKTAQADEKGWINGDAAGLIGAYKTVCNYLDENRIILLAESELTPNLRDISEITAIIEDAAAEYGNRLDGVFIDYVQIISNRDFKNPAPTAIIGDICTKIQSLAVRLNIPVVMAAQMQRNSQIDKFNNNMLSDSKELENTARTVIMLYNSVGGVDAKNVAADFATDINNQFNGAFGMFETKTPGALYAVCTKNRGGLRTCRAVWGFTPETGKINNRTPDTDTGQNWQPSPEPATQNRRPAADADRDTGQNGGKTVKLLFDKDAD